MVQVMPKEEFLKDQKEIKGEFDLRTLASTIKGGESGEPALVPGKPEQSPLYLAVTRKHKDWSAMPPKEAERHIARYKLPKAFVFVPEIVCSPSGKADYRWAKQTALDA